MRSVERRGQNPSIVRIPVVPTTGNWINYSYFPISLLAVTLALLKDSIILKEAIPAMAQSDAGLISGKIRELTRLIRETRLAETTTDVSDQADSAASANSGLARKFADKLRGQTRLDALAQSLRSVYADIPKVAQARQDSFTFALLPGKPPRFWVDLTSFVVMTDGGQTFHFMKDMPEGRITLFQSDSLEETANAITDYVAERIVQQRADGHVSEAAVSDAAPTVTRQPRPDPALTADVSKPDETVPVAETVEGQNTVASDTMVRYDTAQSPIIIQPAPARTDWVKVFLAFALGVFVGAVALFLAAWFQTPSAL